MIDHEKHICVDEDECLKGMDVCRRDPSIASCINTVGSYLCACAEGYVGSGLASLGSAACLDQDECQMPKLGSVTGHLHLCHPESRCENTPGSYTCTCNTGYRGEGRCYDFNECFDDADNGVVTLALNSDRPSYFEHMVRTVSPS